MSGQSAWEDAAAVLPETLFQGLLQIGRERLEQLEELRLRRGFPMTALLPGGEIETVGPRVGEEELRQVVENATQASAHTALDRVRQGFVTLRGGHRVGMCGTVACRDGQIITLREISSLSIRVARCVEGPARPLLPELMEDGTFLSTLILAPPGAGKTTLLRDFIRGLSDGDAGPPRRVGVVDERGEIAALCQGEPQFYVGRHTDVMDGCSKAEGLSMLIRGMNPQVAAVKLNGDSIFVLGWHCLDSESGESAEWHWLPPPMGPVPATWSAEHPTANCWRPEYSEGWLCWSGETANGRYEWRKCHDAGYGGCSADSGVRSHGVGSG